MEDSIMAKSPHKEDNTPADNYYCDTYKGGSLRIRRRKKRIRRVLLTLLIVILALFIAAAGFLYYKFNSYYRLTTYVPEKETFEIRETLEPETYVNEAGEIVEQTEAMLGESEAEGVSRQIKSAVDAIREAQAGHS